MSGNLNIPAGKSAVPQTPANSFASPSHAAPGGSTSTQPTVEDVAEESEDENEQSAAALLANNPALASLVQSKLAGLVGKSSGYVESLPQAVRTRINGLKGVQVEHAKIETEFQLEILKLEKKFASKYAPLYSRRSAIISGEAEPTAEEIAAGEAADSDDEDEEATVEEVNEGDDQAVKGIPQFWLTALQNHQGIADLITERDETALEALTDIKLAYLEDAQPGFKLVFKFGPNDFFENAELEKTYYYQEEVGYGGDFVYERAEGTEIKWKADQDLTKTVEVKKQRNKTTNKTRIVKKVVPTDSFFNFFSPPSPPTMESLENGDVDEEELEALDERLELDYQIGEDLKERIIPRAVDFFLGKNLGYEDEGSEGEFDEEDDYDEDDDEDEDDEDAAPRRGGNKAPGAAGGAEDPQECKQQ